MTLGKKAEYAASWIDNIADHSDENSSLRLALLEHLAVKIQDAQARIKAEDERRIEELLCSQT